MKRKFLTFSNLLWSLERKNENVENIRLRDSIFISLKELNCFWMMGMAYGVLYEVKLSSSGRVGSMKDNKNFNKMKR